MPPGGIRTHNLSGRAVVDLRLRPRGHWDRQYLKLPKPNKLRVKSDISHADMYSTVQYSTVQYLCLNANFEPPHVHSMQRQRSGGV